VQRVRERTFLKNVILTSARGLPAGSASLALPEEARHGAPSFPDTIDFLELIGDSPDDPVCEVTDLKNELALLQYTGGTTGIPKGAMISHYSLSVAALGTCSGTAPEKTTCFWGSRPSSTSWGQTVLMAGPLVAGAKIVVLSRFVPEVVAEAIGRYRCTFWVGATTMMIALLNLPDIDQYDFSSLRCVWSGGTTICH